MSCSHRLAWGQVDPPPLSIALLALVRGVAGDHLAALRIASAMFVGRDSAEVAGEFASVRVVGIANHPLAMPYEQDMPIIIARGFRSDLATARPAGKHYE